MEDDKLDVVTVTDEAIEFDDGSRSMLTASSVVLRYTGLSKLMVCKDLYQNLRYSAIPTIASRTRPPAATPMATPAKKPSLCSLIRPVLNLDLADEAEGDSSAEPFGL